MRRAVASPIHAHAYFSLADPLCEEDNEHEEEFYYNEIEIPLNLSGPPPAPTAARSPLTPSVARPGVGSAKRKRMTDSAHSLLAVAALPVLADHMDMARPPHENPEYYRDGWQCNDHFPYLFSQ